jgi:60 kDa SS-A/Ro ribonucleoprotein
MHMTDVYGGFTTKSTPQRERARSDQVKNSAGGFVFAISPEAQVRRFLILGTDKPTYYTSAPVLTKQNAQVILAFAQGNGPRLVEIIKEISLSGRAPKQQPAIFALALAASHGNGQKEALAAIPQVCRTSTHLFLFVKYVEQFRGWGRALKRGVATWYTSKSAESLAYQAIKYRQREGWTHRDVLRLAKPKGVTGDLSDVIQWITKGHVPESPGIIGAFEQVQHFDAGGSFEQVIREFNLPWEAIPDARINDPDVLRVLAAPMGMTALIRQLPRFSRAFTKTDPIWNQIAERLQDPEQIRKARIHPVNVLVALRTYAAGRGERGQDWPVVTKVVDALDVAFYLSFGNIEPSGKRTYIGLDVSGSMSVQVATNLSARDASAAMAMSIVASEPFVDVYSFSDRSNRRSWSAMDTYMKAMPLSKRQRLDDVVRMSQAASAGFGRTDCALPMIHATEQGLEVDTFVIFTDNETWFGDTHPFQALKAYRERSGIQARLIVAALTPTNFSIADPTDPGMLDIAGFDSNLPALVADFSAGR